MGGKNSSPLNQIDLASLYTVTHKAPELFLTFLRHKQTNKQYVLRQTTFTEQRQFTLSSQRLKYRKNIKNNHLTSIERIEERKEDNMCSHYFKIYSLWEHPTRTLADEINDRALQRKPFENKELWSILACSIVGLSSLQQNEIRHECLTTRSILMQEGNIKICDPASVGLQTNFESLFHNRTLRHIYPSPEQCEALESQKPIINKNSFKNDVFSLAVILLECGLLQRQDQCYLDDCSKINWNRIQANLTRFGNNYQQDLQKIVSLMLTRDIRNRPDWLDLNKFVNQDSQKNNLKQYNSLLPRKNHFITRTVKSLMPSKAQKRQSNRTIEVGGETKINGHIRETSPVKEGYPYPGYHAALPKNPVEQYHTSYAPSTSVTQNINQRLVAGYSSPLDQNNQYNSFKLYPVNSPPLAIFQNQLNIEKTRISSQTPYKTGSTTLSVFPSNNAIQYPLHQNNFNSHIPLTSTYSTSIPNVSTSLNNTNMYPSNPAQITNISDYIRPATSVNYQLLQPNSPQKTNLPQLNRAHDIAAARYNQQNQHPQYVEEHFKVGSKYEGYKLNGMRHGMGKFYYQDGGFYDGEWKYNKMEGYGTLYYQSNNKAYQGSWINDQFHGKGILYNDRPQFFDDCLDYNNFDDIDDLWEYYQGNFHEDEKDGKGKLKFCNNQYFQGTFKKDMVEGQGTFHCMDGKIIHGIWRQNQLVTMLD